MDTEPQLPPDQALEPEIELKKQKPPYLRRFAIIIGFATLAAALALYFSKPSIEPQPTEGEEEPYVQYFRPLPSPSPMQRNEGNTANDVYNKALEAYDNQQYTEAIDLFRQALDDSDFASVSGPEASLYLAISLLETKQPLAALEILEPYELHPDYKDEVRWYQALGFIQSDQKENILHTLFSIARNPEHPHNEDAHSLIGEFIPDKDADE